MNRDSLQKRKHFYGLIPSWENSKYFILYELYFKIVFKIIGFLFCPIDGCSETCLNNITWVTEAQRD